MRSVRSQRFNPLFRGSAPARSSRKTRTLERMSLSLNPLFKGSADSRMKNGSRPSSLRTGFNPLFKGSADSRATEETHELPHQGIREQMPVCGPWSPTSSRRSQSLLPRLHTHRWQSICPASRARQDAPKSYTPVVPCVAASKDVIRFQKSRGLRITVSSKTLS